MFAREKAPPVLDPLIADRGVPAGRFYRRDASSHELFEDQAARSPNSVAVMCGARQLTYRSLNGRANQLARHLQANGLRPGGCVAISSVRSI